MTLSQLLSDNIDRLKPQNGDPAYTRWRGIDYEGTIEDTGAQTCLRCDHGGHLIPICYLSLDVSRKRWQAISESP